MADQGGSKSESEGEQVFQNKDSPLKDPAVCTLESKVRQRKKALTLSVNKIIDAVKIINKASEGGSLNGLGRGGISHFIPQLTSDEQTSIRRVSWQ